MTKGRELPVNCKARRRLFSEEEPDNPKQEGGITRTEHVARHLKDEMNLAGTRWNFDFKNEVALEGPIQWYRKGSEEEWVGMQPTRRTLNMRKRKMDSESPTNATHEDEQSKVRRQFLLTGLRTREFFENERTKRIAALIKQLTEDDNQINSFNEEFREADNTFGKVPGFGPHDVPNPNSQDKRDGKTYTSEVEKLAANKVEADRLKILDEKSAADAIRDIAMDASDEFLPEDELANLRISEMNNKFEEVPGGMMRQNQATPRNEKNYAMPQGRKGKVLKKHLTQGTKKRINFD